MSALASPLPIRYLHKQLTDTVLLLGRAARVNETLGELGMELPPEPSLLPSLDLAALLCPHRGGPKCSVTCNGRTPWY